MSLLRAAEGHSSGHTVGDMHRQRQAAVTAVSNSAQFQQPFRATTLVVCSARPAQRPLQHKLIINRLRCPPTPCSASCTIPCCRCGVAWFCLGRCSVREDRLHPFCGVNSVEAAFPLRTHLVVLRVCNLVSVYCVYMLIQPRHCRKQLLCTHSLSWCDSYTTKLALHLLLCYECGMCRSSACCS